MAGHLEHDYGHDAFVLLVEGEKVHPSEIAIQIKSGKSFCRESECLIPATRRQLDFWCAHPLRTIGFVFDPAEGRAYWVDLKSEAEDRRFSRERSNAVRFQKEEWNRFDAESFHPFFLELILGRPPRLPFSKACLWARSENYDYHQVGVDVLLAYFRDNDETWILLLDLLQHRNFENSSPSIVWAIAHIPCHYDILSYFGSGIIAPEVRAAARSRLKQFGYKEVVKLLRFVDDMGFERTGIGQSVGAIIVSLPDYESILRSVAKDVALNVKLKEAASILLSEKEILPIWPR